MNKIIAVLLVAAIGVGVWKFWPDIKDKVEEANKDDNGKEGDDKDDKPAQDPKQPNPAPVNPGGGFPPGPMNNPPIGDPSNNPGGTPPGAAFPGDGTNGAGIPGVSQPGLPGQNPPGVGPPSVPKNRPMHEVKLEMYATRQGNELYVTVFANIEDELKGGYRILGEDYASRWIETTPGRPGSFACLIPPNVPERVTVQIRFSPEDVTKEFTGPFVAEGTDERGLRRVSAQVELLPKRVRASRRQTRVKLSPVAVE